MTDRELLELAAKAFGVEIHWTTNALGQETGPWNNGGSQWNPLTDDGDALRLAVKLEMFAGYAELSGNGSASWKRGSCSVSEYGPEDPYATTRRAIVRAAAEIGKTP